MATASTAAFPMIYHRVSLSGNSLSLLPGAVELEAACVCVCTCVCVSRSSLFREKSRTASPQSPRWPPHALHGPAERERSGFDAPTPGQEHQDFRRSRVRTPTLLDNRQTRRGVRKSMLPGSWSEAPRSLSRCFPCV
ncbi:unnamed protein product [Pleuronectes platessa]|uniref:Uncharacterized protein n=1 Tax=Pleuronectes platessa TaxID=8262 RepID=A0A9N7Z2L1_PLEPL|nr:unnamed protein product [Pleuronectes platessa]